MCLEELESFSKRLERVRLLFDTIVPWDRAFVESTGNCAFWDTEVVETAIPFVARIETRAQIRAWLLCKRCHLLY